MSLSGLLRCPIPRRHVPKPASRRRPPCLEGLEDRVVLSHATATALALHAPAQVHALAGTASQALSVPISIAQITVTSAGRDGSGAETFSGTATGTILGQTFTTPVTGAIAAGRGRGASVLTLHLQPIGLNLVGLGVATSGIGLSVTARNSGGVLGKQVGGQLKDVLASTGGDDDASVAALLNDAPLLDAINKSLARARPDLTSFAPSRGADGAALDFSLRRVRMNARGLSVRPDRARNGPVTVNLTATRDGGLFGGLVSDLPGGTSRRALARQVGGVLQRIASTPVPTLDQLASAKTAATAQSGATSAIATTSTGSTLITIDLKPLDVNLLGLEVKTSEITVTVTAEPGSGKLLGNLLATVSNLINLQGVNNALNNVLANVVNLANAATLNVSGVGTGGPLGTSTSTADVPVLTAHVAPVHLDLLGAVVDTSPIDLSIIAHPGQGQVLGNVIAGLANLLNTLPKNGKLDIPFLTSQVHTLNDQLAALTPSIPPSPSPVHTVPPGTTNVLSLNVAPIHLNLLGLVLQTDQIQVNADAQAGPGDLLGNLLTGVLNAVNGTPTNLTALNGEVNALLAKVVGVLNATTLVLPPGALGSLSQTLQTLALPDLVNTTGTPATAPVLNLDIASTSDDAPPIDVDLLGLIVTTSDVHAQLVAQTGDGQVLGNLVYNVSHLLDPGGALGLITILNALGL